MFLSYINQVSRWALLALTADADTIAALHKSPETTQSLV